MTTTNAKPQSATVAVALTAKEKHLIEELRKTPYAEVHIVMHQGEPTRIEQVREKIQL